MNVGRRFESELDEFALVSLFDALSRNGGGGADPSVLNGPGGSLMNDLEEPNTRFPFIFVVPTSCRADSVEETS